MLMFIMLALVASLTVHSLSAQTTYRSYLPAPSSVRELADQVDVVVHGVVREVSRAAWTDGGVARLVVIDPITLEKGASRLADRKAIVVQQFGGTISVDGTERSTDFAGSPLLEGSEVVLFLSDAGADRPLQIPFGHGGILRVNRASGDIWTDDQKTFTDLPAAAKLGDVITVIRRSK